MTYFERRREELLMGRKRRHKTGDRSAMWAYLVRERVEDIQRAARAAANRLERAWK